MSNILGKIRALNKDTDLVAWYRFNNGSGTLVEDQSNNSNDGTASGGMAWEKGRIEGFSGQFDGIDDEIALPTIGGNTNYTQSLWFYSTGDGTQYQTLLETDDGRIGINLDSGNPGFDYYSWDSRASGTGDTQRASGFKQGSFEVNKWNHVAVVATSNTSLLLYVNGVFVSSSTFIDNPASTLAGSRIGSLQSTIEYFDGQIDDVRIYSRVLDATEINALANEQRYDKIWPQGEVTQGLVGRWLFHDPAGTSMEDFSGQGNDGTINGSMTIASGSKVGRFGGNFDGVDDKVNLGAISDFAFMHQTGSKYTISTFVNFSTVAGTQRFMILGGDGDSRDNVGISFAYDEFDADEMKFIITNGSGVEETSKIIEGRWPWVPSAGIWYHLTLTYDHSLPSANAELFIDSISQGTKDKTINIPSSANPTNIMSLGSRTYNSDMFFNGLIDDVRVYNRVLTLAEIKKIYNMYR